MRLETDGSTGWTVHTDVFDGPLDLLLHLVRRDGVDLRQVSMAQVCDGYLAYLDQMRVLHLGIAADYLVMAATLVHLKSLELLPRPPTSRVADGPEEDPRERLVRRLVEHERFRAAAVVLDALPRVGRDVFVREPLSIADAPRRVVAGIGVFGLLDLYHQLLLRTSAAEPIHEVGGAGLDLGTVVRRCLQRLGGLGQETTLAALLAGIETLAERVLTFLGVLEMARLEWVTVDQAEHLGPVRITSLVTPDVDVELLMGRA